MDETGMQQWSASRIFSVPCFDPERPGGEAQGFISAGGFFCHSKRTLEYISPMMSLPLSSHHSILFTL